MFFSSQIGYALRGMVRRYSRQRSCSCCNATQFVVIDRKFPYELLFCTTCGILSRFPSESSEEMAAFYESGYQQKGLTTDLPSDETLQHLTKSRFVDSEKDATPIIRLLGALKVLPPSRILDYGANWGYTTWQLREAGYAASAFEISATRAAFGSKIGVKIATTLDFSPCSLDVVFSSHVLEHVENPLTIIRAQLDLVRSGGFVIGLTPNGSLIRRSGDPWGFHNHWGRVHPVLLGAEFLQRSFGNLACYVASILDPTPLARWDARSNHTEDLNSGELLFVLRRP